jgi:hypothetical protein
MFCHFCNSPGSYSVRFKAVVCWPCWLLLLEAEHPDHNPIGYCNECIRENKAKAI